MKMSTTADQRSALAGNGESIEQTPATILVIDDDFPLRTLFDLYLTKFGYRTLMAEGGNQALKIASENPDIQLVILDVMMSGMSGQDLAVELTKLLPDTAMLFCSGHPAYVVAHLGIDVTGGRFMEKPCRPPELKQRVSELLAARLLPN